MLVPTHFCFHLLRSRCLILADVFLFLLLTLYNTGLWFGTFFIFPYIGNNHPNWLIFFRGVETTNQNGMGICLMFFTLFSPLEQIQLLVTLQMGTEPTSSQRYEVPHVTSKYEAHYCTSNADSKTTFWDNNAKHLWRQPFVVRTFQQDKDVAICSYADGFNNFLMSGLVWLSQKKLW